MTVGVSPHLFWLNDGFYRCIVICSKNIILFSLILGTRFQMTSDLNGVKRLKGLFKDDEDGFE